MMTTTSSVRDISEEAKSFRKALFTADVANYTPIPPRYPDVKQWYDDHQAGFWVAEEVDL